MIDELEEEWVSLAFAGFDRYQVSNLGYIRNGETGGVLRISRTREGLAKIGLLRDDKRQYTVAVTPLVARAFLGEPPNESFDTPINLDGDRMNNAAYNLAWRPRWFAVKYNRQFHDPKHSVLPVINMRTQEVFANSWDAAIHYGLIERQLCLAARRQSDDTFPLFDTFAFLEN